jgi:hypothetical protein
MLGTIASALWAVLSADDFAVPRWVFHELVGLLGSVGSAA